MLQLCTDDKADALEEFITRVMARTCRPGEESCCVEAGLVGELFHPTGNTGGCPSGACGEVLSCVPETPLLAELGLNDTDVAAVSTLCRVLGRDSEARCESIRIAGERACTPVHMCRLTVDSSIAPGSCAGIAAGAAECADGAADTQEALACLASRCDGLCDDGECGACQAIVLAMEGQEAAGWSLGDLDVEEAVYGVCQYVRLRGVHPYVDHLLDGRCEEDSGHGCLISVPGFMVPRNPFARRVCDPAVHCCALDGVWQLGPEPCEEQPSCEFRGRAASGTCTKTLDCAGCEACIDELVSVSAGASADEYTAGCKAAASSSGAVAYCDEFDWDMWLENALINGAEPNARAACRYTGFCDYGCIGRAESLCPYGADSNSTAPVQLPASSCREGRDCANTDDICRPYDFTDDADSQCVEQVECDPDTGFFYSYCLGGCQSRRAAACANFRDGRLDLLLDLLMAYRCACVGHAAQHSVSPCSAAKPRGGLPWEALGCYA